MVSGKLSSSTATCTAFLIHSIQAPQPSVPCVVFVINIYKMVYLGLHSPASSHPPPAVFSCTHLLPSSATSFQQPASQFINPLSSTEMFRNPPPDADAEPKTPHAYLDSLQTTINSADNDTRDSSLLLAAFDPLRIKLAPDIGRLVAQSVLENPCKLPVLNGCMRLVGYLLENKSIQGDLYVQLMLPAILHCVVGSILSEGREENHWSLRDSATLVMRRICISQVGKLDPTFEAKYKETLRDTIADTGSALPSIYGGVIGLAVFGIETLVNWVLPELSALLSRVQEVWMSSTGFEKREAAKVYGAILWAISYSRPEGEAMLRAAMALSEDMKEMIRLRCPERLPSIIAHMGGLVEEMGDSLLPFSTRLDPENAITVIPSDHMCSRE